MSFQFHTGSIKSRLCEILCGLGCKRFNSILVRLKVSPTTPAGVTFTGFNSILVRLKERCDIYRRDACSVFQFHTGSIKRHVIAPREVVPSILFQFHTGSIKRVTDSQRQLFHGLFQFHTGSIKRKEVVRVLRGYTGFNSILVRLKAMWIDLTDKDLCAVSIPYCFD